MPQLTVRKLSPALLQDYLHYFDHVGFTDNADWAACYCLFYHFHHDTAKWEERTAEQNRSTISDLINNDQHHGYLAYVDNQIAGWCHAAPRTELYTLQLQEELKVDDAEQVGSIVCFNVAPDRRGQGVATALLTAACTGFKEIGLRVAEGYPRLKTDSITSNYKGPLKMYLDAGFTKFREFEHSMIVRRAL
ncbi:MAG TPA: GNAT family N-acetyltransferase [Anaerolineae bacterium]|nr:GNAT family N-acetyltransferase [Anaerolineae bacterium]